MNTVSDRAQGYDVAIIGGGVMGLSTAVHLTERGARVVVLDRGPLAREASWLNAGGVRQSNRDLREIPLALLAVSLWPGLAEYLGRPTGYRQTGNLRVALDEAEREELRAAVGPQRALGLDIRWLEPAAAREIVPDLGPEVRGATWCPTDGQAEPSMVVGAWLHAAERLGVALRPNLAVDAIEVAGGRVTGVRAGEQVFAAPVVLNAAGPWSGQVGQLAGVTHPVEQWLAEVLEFPAGTAEIGPFLAWRRLSFRQTLHGTLWAALSSRPYGSFQRHDAVTEECERLLRDIGGRILDRSLGEPVRGWTGITAWPPDWISIMDAAAGPHGYVVASGFSGHGFALHPAVGLLMSQLILDGRTQIPLDDFRNSRFATADVG